MATTRDELISAAKVLLWERGFEGTSPAAILERSGAGQGSLYHHFRGKSDLAATALAEVSKEMRGRAEKRLHFESPEAALSRIVAFLTAPRDALRGCRLGRFANESSLDGNAAVLAPIREYFSHVETLLAGAISEGQASGQIVRRVSADDLAVALIAVVQGGFVLARVFSDRAYMHRATNAAVQLIQAHAMPRKP